MNTQDPRALRDAFGTFMTGVTVVTGYDADGAPIGCTANSFTSVSLDPPLLLVCLNTTSKTCVGLIGSGAFAVNILAEAQSEISTIFAKPSEDRFAGLNWRVGPHGGPIFAGVSTWFDCTLHDTVEAGDHIILIGRVMAYDSQAAPGLGFVRGSYINLTSANAALDTDPANLKVSALIEQSGQVLLMDHESGNAILPARRADKDGATRTLDDLIAETGLEVRPSFIYAFYEDHDSGQHEVVFLCHAEAGKPAKGAFHTVNGDSIAMISDGALKGMLQRFAREHALGNFGIYLGNSTSGKVRPTDASRDFIYDAQFANTDKY